MVVLAAFLAMASITGLRSQTPSSTTTSPAGLILGRVVEVGSTKPIPGVVVTMADPAAGPGSASRPRQVLTNAQGRFVFRQVPKGSYTLTATIGGNGFTPNGFIVSGQGFQIGAYLNGGFGQRRPGGPLQTIDLADGQRLGDVEIGLWKGASISGTVRDETGEPLIGVVVGAVRVTSDGRLLTGPTKKTDDRGMYHIGTLVPGAYLVFVPQTQALVPAERVDTALARNLTLPSGLTVGRSILSVTPDMLTSNSLAPASSSAGTFAYRTTFHPSADAAVRATRLRIGSGEDRANVDVDLRPVRTVGVSGKLLRDGAPVAAMTVHLMPAETKDGTSVLELASTSTDGSGAFVFPLVPAGQYSIVALRNASSGNPGGPPGGAAPPVVGEWASQPIVVGGVDLTDVVVSMQPGARVSGHVEFIGGSDRLPAARLQQLTITGDDQSGQVPQRLGQPRTFSSGCRWPVRFQWRRPRPLSVPRSGRGALGRAIGRRRRPGRHGHTVDDRGHRDPGPRHHVRRHVNRSRRRRP